MIDTRALRQLVGRIVAPLRDRVMLMVARGVVERVRDNRKLQEVQAQVGAGQLAGRLERFQEYGFTSKPKPGAECVAVFVGGNRDHGLVVAVDDRRYRITGMESGEVAIYTDEGDCLHFKRNHVVELTCGTFRVTASDSIVLDAPDIDVGL